MRVGTFPQMNGPNIYELAELSGQTRVPGSTTREISTLKIGGLQTLKESRAVSVVGPGAFVFREPHRQPRLLDV